MSDRINNYKKSLYIKNPELENIELVVLKDTGLMTNEISEFIEASWNDTYGDEARLVYSPDFIKWLLENSKNLDISFAVKNKKNNELAGIFLGLSRNVITDNNDILKCAIHTGLSVKPSYKNKGIGAFILLERLYLLKKKQFDLAFDWYDIRKDKQGSAFQISKKNPLMSYAFVNVNGKTFDIAKAEKYQALNIFEKSVLKLNLFINRPQTKKLDGISSDLKNIDEMMALCSLCNAHRPLCRHFTKDEFIKQLNGCKQNILIVLEKDGKPKAILQGFKNKINNEDAVAYLDMVLFHPDLTFREKRNFLREAEYRIENEHHCFSAIVLDSATNENLLKYGYLPFEKQAIACFPISEKHFPGKKELKKIFLDLK